MEDAALVARAAAGDGTAFELLVRRNADPVWRLARTILRDDFAAEEAVQDTFLKAHRALSSYRGDASVKTWLCSICHRACIDRLRKKQAQVVPLEALRQQKAREEHVELRLVIEEAMEELSDDERRAFELVHVLGYSREEAAAIAGVPPSTMRSRVTRARTRLAESIGGPEARMEER
jgi:RNA polymerase sigma-70 factor (ECF subfamily)